MLEHNNILIEFVNFTGESVILELAVDSSQVLNFGTTMSVTSVTVCSTTKQCFSEVSCNGLCGNYYAQ